MSLDGIAKEDLWMAAHDLRNAALVIDHAGHHKGSMLNTFGGELCAGGAIEVATYRPLAYRQTVRLFALTESGAPSFRAENAYAVLADFLPTGLCPTCEPYRSPEHVVVHYNDAHCTGGTLLANMMRLAADEAINVIADDRKLLTGTRVPVTV